jgi:hypothetical protein
MFVRGRPCPSVVVRGRVVSEAVVVSREPS